MADEKEVKKEGLIYELMSTEGEHKFNAELTELNIEDAAEDFLKLYRNAKRKKADIQVAIKSAVLLFEEEKFNADYIVDLEMTLDDLDEQMKKIKVVYKKIFGKDFPQD